MGHRDGRLRTIPKPHDEVEVFLLVTGKFPEFTIVGYAATDELLNKENIIDLGHGPGYGLSQDRLKACPI